MTLPLYVTRDVDRYGKVRLYFQRVHKVNGKRVKSRKVRLPDDPTSVDFAEAYAAARRAEEAPPPVPVGTISAAVPGTLRDLLRNDGQLEAMREQLRRLARPAAAAAIADLLAGLAAGRTTRGAEVAAR